MAVITGVTGQITSWAGTTHGYIGGTAAGVATGVTVKDATLTMECEEFDATAFTTTGYAAAIKGLRSWSCEWTAYLKDIAHGGAANGLVTYTGGYTTNLNAWTMDVTRDELDSTQFSDTVKTYIPGLMHWGGTFGGWTDGTTDVIAAGLPATDATGIFQYQTAAAVADLRGTIFTTRGTVTSRPADIVTVEYGYKGTSTLTQSNPTGEGIFPDGDVPFDAAGSLVFLAHTGLQFTGDAFWSRVAITCRVGALTEISVRARGTGALTIA